MGFEQKVRQLRVLSHENERQKKSEADKKKDALLNSDEWQLLIYAAHSYELQIALRAFWEAAPKPQSLDNFDDCLSIEEYPTPISETQYGSIVVRLKYHGYHTSPPLHPVDKNLNREIKISFAFAYVNTRTNAQLGSKDTEHENYQILQPGLIIFVLHEAPHVEETIELVFQSYEQLINHLAQTFYERYPQAIVESRDNSPEMTTMKSTDESLLIRQAEIEFFQNKVLKMLREEWLKKFQGKDLTLFVKNFHYGNRSSNYQKHLSDAKDKIQAIIKGEDQAGLWDEVAREIAIPHMLDYYLELLVVSAHEGDEESGRLLLKIIGSTLDRDASNEVILEKLHWQHANILTEAGGSKFAGGSSSLILRKAVESERIANPSEERKLIMTILAHGTSAHRWTAIAYINKYMLTE